jgi:hypothetical protein
MEKKIWAFLGWATTVWAPSAGAAWASPSGPVGAAAMSD